MFPDLSPAIYEVQSLKHGNTAGSKNAIIEVYPTFSVDGEITTKYELSKVEKSDKKKKSKERRKGGWSIEGSLALKHNTTNWEIGKEGPKFSTEEGFLGSLLDKANKFFDFFDKIKSHYDDIKDQLPSARNPKPTGGSPDSGDEEDTPTFKARFELPELTIKANSTLVEVDKKYEVGLNSTIKLDGKLFGAGIECDILGLILEMGGPYGKLAQYIRENVEDVGTEEIGAGIKVGVIVKVNGSLPVKAKLEKKAATPWEGNGKIEGIVNLSAKGFVEVEGRFLFVKFAAGVTIEAKGAENSKDPAFIKGGVTITSNEAQEIEFQGYLLGNGFAIYFMAYIEVGIDKVESGTEASTVNNGRGIVEDDTLEDDSENRKEYDSQYILIDPWKWPNSGKLDAKKALSD